MGNKLFTYLKSILCLLLAATLMLSTGCSNTKHLADNQYLLRRTRIVFNTEARISNKGEIKDNLSRLIVQKPNNRFLGIPFKLMLYNRHYERLHARKDEQLSKTVQRPVIVDTALMQRSIRNMKNYLFSQGYFYSKISDTFRVRHKKAFVSYTIDAGINYKINKVNYFIEDSNIARIVQAGEAQTLLQKDVDFRYGLLEDERSRITTLVRNSGYYKFTQENVNFINGIDTVDKTQFKNAQSPFERTMMYVLSARRKKVPTVDLDVHIQMFDDTTAFTIYKISSVNVYPDYTSPADLTDTSLAKKIIGGVYFKFHNEYVHPHVLYEHMFLSPGNTYAQSDYDKTIAKLTELGIFQFIRIVPTENRRLKGLMSYDIFLSKSKKHDFSYSYELSSGTTYFLGNSLSLNYRDRNLLKGANLLTVGVNGGVEFTYNNNEGKNVYDHFSLLTRYYGANASIDFPKFLAPVASSLFTNSNLPHTIIGGGENIIDRVNYFTLLNTSANFSYNWHQTQTITWTLTPAFINVILLPTETDAFRKVLANNAYLRNSYKENLIEGENISLTYDDMIKKHGRNYSYLRLGIEEAGTILGAINQVNSILKDLYKIQFAQYVKFDFDARHYFSVRHTVFALRFFGGIGIPYAQSDALPYIKQYFAGGPYSLRGWRIRTLGPGSFFDAANTGSSNLIDRTGDIKLEFNSEYRFPIAPLFAGAIKMNGALFFDAGNIWLARADTSFAGGNFKFSSLGQDIAADVGVGTRFDIASFLTLRVDAAMPIKKPYVFKNGGWVFSDISPSNATWRSNNIVLNISIGYPF